MSQINERNDDLYDYLDDWENEPTPFYTLETVHLYHKEIEEFEKLVDSNEELKEWTENLFKSLGFSDKKKNKKRSRKEKKKSRKVKRLVDTQM
ncbi:hypothetical protein [Veillonella sp. DNF00869]|jgi:hypothetical protein|uniref:hypothetical protein n=1 Tax=Veillonella sp. DNF00869 TaxID=1384081 RepID=UPI0007826EF6|nr:hypothetical protein [Veillonella sp. DNF00869]KXB87262.1 hypothetical protein HMPREF3032_01081 [Veillonella sp. DNF00869]